MVLIKNNLRNFNALKKYIKSFLCGIIYHTLSFNSGNSSRPLARSFNICCVAILIYYKKSHSLFEWLFFI